MRALLNGSARRKAETVMNNEAEILLAIGRIEGRLEAYASLTQRVSSLERWQSWLKGGWAAVAAMFAWLLRGSLTK